MLRTSALLFFLLAFLPAAHAQEEDPPIEAPPMVMHGNPIFTEDTSYSQRYMIDVGLTNIRPWALNQALFGPGIRFPEFVTVGLSENFSDEWVDIGDETFMGNDATVSLHWFLANEMTAVRADGDAMYYRMKGWELMTSVFAFNLLPNEHVDLVVGYATYWGNLKLRSENKTEGTGRMLYKNPFVAPAIRAELRFNFASLTFGGRFSYRYDITNDIWKRFNDNLEPLPGYRFRDTQFMFYIGFWLRDSIV
jgi:hypothetical protein